MKQKKLIFNFFVNRNWKKLTDSRKRAKILADNSKNHHPIETTLFLLPTNKTFEGICLARAGKFLQKELWFILSKRLLNLVLSLFMTSQLNKVTQDLIFLDILKTDSVRHAGHVLKTMRITKCPRSTIESTSSQGECLKSLEISKEAFYVFRRIKAENSWKWNKFKTVMYLTLSTTFKTFPGCLITATKHSVLCILSGFVAFI